MAATRVNTQDLKDGGVATADIATAAVTFPKLNVPADSGLESDGSDRIRIKIASGGALSRDNNGIGIAPGFVGVSFLTLSTDAAQVASGGTGVGTGSDDGIYITGVRRFAGDVPSAADGMSWFDDTDQVLKTRVKGTTARMSSLGFQSATDSTAIANTTTETQFSNCGFVIPSGHATLGRTYRVTAWGRYSTTGTPNMAFNLKCDSGNTPAASGNLAGINNASNRSWFVRGTLIVKTAGASGVLNALIEAGLDNTVTNQRRGTSTQSLATGRTLNLSAQWSAASSSNTITCEGCVWETVG